MQNCTYYAPTEVVFGKNTESQTGALIRKWGGSRVLIHYGGSSAKKSGLLDRITASLAEENIPFVLLGGVVPNPRLSKVREGIELGRREQIDFILAVGGGSVIDSAKAIGYGLSNEGDVWDFYTKKRTPSACLPLGAVLTIAAAGSEMSDSSVITNEEGWLKRGCSSNFCRCRFAVMNPELTCTLPPYQTASGCTDILMHTMERYFTNDKRMDLTDELAEGLLRSVVRNARILKEEPLNYEARASIMWAGSLSHNDLTHFGSGRGDWACHQLEHELGGMFDVAHGAGLAAVWGSWPASSSPPIQHALPAMPAGYGISGKRTTRKPPWPGSWPQKTSSGRLRCPPPSPNWDCSPQRNSWIPWPSNVLTKTPAPSAISKNWVFPKSGKSTVSA